MSRNTLCVIAISSWLALGRAQMPSVRVEISNAAGMEGDLVVCLLDFTSHERVQYGALSQGGTFQFDGVPPGAYILRVVRLPDQTISEEIVQLHGGAFLTLRVPEGAPRTPGGTVSKEQLQHPLSKKGAKMIVQAQQYARAGRHDKAVEQLQAALREPSAVPYARSILGVEYLKLGNAAAALPELEEAVRLLPHDVADRSNLGYALFVLGQKERAEQEVRRALELDPRNPKARYLLEIIRK